MLGRNLKGQLWSCSARVFFVILKALLYRLVLTKMLSLGICLCLLLIMNVMHVLCQLSLVYLTEHQFQNLFHGCSDT